jgi:hypothetical protein
MDKFVWFSRHSPTREQLADVPGVLICVDEGKELGTKNMETDIDVNLVISELVCLVKKGHASGIIGVFATPIQARLIGAGVPCYASWNVQRCAEGGKSTFVHKAFCCVGFLRV